MGCMDYLGALGLPHLSWAVTRLELLPMISCLQHVQVRTSSVDGLPLLPYRTALSSHGEGSPERTKRS